MADQRNIPKAELIQDAGIIVGWLFWKKCFDRFGWLQGGKFYNKNGMYTGILAANWLTRLGIYYVDTINPFIITICDLLVDDSRYLIDSELESYLGGETLDASIDDYYFNLMSMWPILNTDRKAEFKELFIQREGVITSIVSGWNLAIVKEPYDALMMKNPIPWPLIGIRFPWTSTTIDVEW